MIFITATRHSTRANARSLRRAYARVERMGAVIKETVVPEMSYMERRKRTLYARGARSSLSGGGGRQAKRGYRPTARTQAHGFIASRARKFTGPSITPVNFCNM